MKLQVETAMELALKNWSNDIGPLKDLIPWEQRCEGGFTMFERDFRRVVNGTDYNQIRKIILDIANQKTTFKPFRNIP